MKLPITFFERHFREKLWFLAHRFVPRSMEPTDLYHDLLIDACLHDFEPDRTPCRVSGCILPINPSHVHRFLLSRALDIRRRAKRKFRQSVNIDDLKHSLSYETVLQTTDDLLTFLKDNLCVLYYEIVLLRAFPSPDMEAAAESDRLAAVSDSKTGRLRMNLRTATVLHRHVAKRVGCSSATVSRALDDARALLEPQIL